MNKIPEIYAVMDWSKHDSQLAEEAGTSSNRVRYWRAKLGKPTSPNRYRHRWHKNFRLKKYGHLDWSKRDVDLAREVGVSRERIRVVRSLLGHTRYRCPVCGVKFKAKSRGALVLIGAGDLKGSDVIRCPKCLRSEKLLCGSPKGDRSEGAGVGP